MDTTLNQGRGDTYAQKTKRIKQAALGNWPAILQSMGIPAKVLDGRNHPCPACGGKDRFQFTVRGYGAEWGRFACRGMDEQGGDGFRLVMHVFGLSFPEAVQAVGNLLGFDCTRPTLSARSQPEKIPADAVAPRADRTARLQAAFDAATPISPSNAAGRYLLRRGLAASHWPDSYSPLRHCDALDYWHVADDQPSKLGAFPALLAWITKPDGLIAGLHRIYLNDEADKLALVLPETGEALPCKKLQTAHDGALTGAACRLYPVGKECRLALAEGIETALAVHRMTGLPVWACISAGGLRSVVLPDAVREVLIYADNDPPDPRGKNAGKEAAYLLASRLVEEGRKVKVLLPQQAGTDWLDVLNDELNRGKA